VLDQKVDQALLGAVTPLVVLTDQLAGRRLGGRRVAQDLLERGGGQSTSEALRPPGGAGPTWRYTSEVMAGCEDAAVLRDDRCRAESFGEDAERYDRSRPSYPDALVDLIAAGGGRDLVDVGCGTGIAARLFAALGWRVLGVEPDGRMAGVARRHGLTVEVARFEDWDRAGRRFDVVTAGQSWHWVDPERGTRRAAEALRAGGRIALFWNTGRFPDALRARLDTVYEGLEPELDWATPPAATAAGELDTHVVAPLTASGAFGPPVVHELEWRSSFTTAAWLDQLATHSDHRVLPAGRREALLAAVGAALDDAGGSFEMAYTTSLVLAVRA